jgi:hypothetical protein
MTVESTKNKKGGGNSLSMSMLLDIAGQFPHPDPVEDEAAHDRVGRIVSRRLPAANSSITSLFASVCHKAYVGPEAPFGGTWATAVDSSGSAVMFITVRFTLDVDVDDGLMILPGHEVYHWLFQHCTDPDRKDQFRGLDEHGKTMLYQVYDAVINYNLMRQGFQLPTIGGKTIGIDPVGLHKWGKEQAAKHNLPWPNHHRELYRTERIALDYFLSLPAPKRESGGGNWCKKGEIIIPGGSDDGHSCDLGDHGEALPRDPAEMEKILTQIVEVVAKQAQKSESAKSELSALIDATEGSELADHLWGTTGALDVVGKVPTKRMSKDWEKDLHSWVATRISLEQERMQYNRKVPFSPRISPKGRSRKKKAVVGLDVSGSVSQEWRTHFISRMGAAFPNLEIDWFLWDANCNRLDLGDEGVGGGGTVWESFDQMVHDLYRSDPPDAILTVTDGYFAKPRPRFDPKLYGWLIIPGGDAFMGAAGGYIAADGTPIPKMRVVRVLDNDARASAA